MKILDPGFDLERFWSALEGAPSRVLLLDYDGTLAPFRRERDEAVPYPGVRESVRRFMEEGHTRVVVVSGRAVADLLPLLGIEPAPEIRGSHGWEVREADEVSGAGGRSAVGDRSGADVGAGGGADRIRLLELPGAAAGGLEEARSRAEEAPIDPGRVEPKPASLAIHTRDLAAGEREGVEGLVREWEAIARRAGLEVQPFDGGIELRVPGRDKGTAVREVLADEPPDAAVAYLGDDLTDEDAFRALVPSEEGLQTDGASPDAGRAAAGRILTALVRTELRETAARLWLRPPEELLDFLATWRSRAWTE